MVQMRVVRREMRGRVVAGFGRQWMWYMPVALVA